LDEGNSVSSISQSFQTAVTKYFENMDFTSTTVCNRVSFAKIMDILINCDGVLDIDHLTINGKEESLILNTREFAVMEVPDITAAE
jgi:uncharacterized phage protein gp47/JayE